MAAKRTSRTAATWKPLLPPPLTTPATVRYETPQHILADLILAPHVTAAIGQLLLEHRHQAALRAEGCTPAIKVLFEGPPGTGKTSAAGAIARELGVHLVVMKQHELISQYMGEGEKAIAATFDFARTEPSVFLLDELDGISSTRGGKSDAADRSQNSIVTTLLTSLDRHTGPGIIIAATNRIDAIDSAARRRFDLEINFPLPDEAMRVELIRRTLGDLDGNFGGSHADIVRMCLAERKRRILDRLENRELKRDARAKDVDLDPDIGSGALHGSMTEVARSAMCEHAGTECGPRKCPCIASCYCRSHTCHPRQGGTP